MNQMNHTRYTLGAFFLGVIVGALFIVVLIIIASDK